MTGERAAGSSPARPAPVSSSSQAPREQRATIRPVASVISNSDPGVAADSAPSRARILVLSEVALAARSSGSAPSAAAPAATSCTCPRKSPRATCRPRSASNLIPCSTLEKMSATATTETAMTGPSAATMRATRRRRRRPCRCSGCATVCSVQFELPRPSHSGGRYIAEARRLPLEDL